MLELLLVLEPLLGVECLSGAGNGTPYIPSVGFLLFVSVPLLLPQYSHSLLSVAEVLIQELLVPEHLLSFPPLF